MTATMTYSSGAFTTTLIDRRSGTVAWTYTSPPTAVSGAARSSAECITERPSIGASLTNLANFGTAKFGQDYTSSSSMCYANGIAFGSFGSAVQQITMVNRKGSVLAQPSSLSSGGSSFYVTWKASS